MSLAARGLRSPWLLPVLLALGAGIAVSRGQDAAWDLRNYHLYNAWAYLHGRLGTDLAPAGLQGYFNPLLDVPYFWLGTGPLANAPRALAAVQGLWYGGLVFVLCRIACRLASQAGRAPGWPDIVAILIGATGTMTLTQAGMSTNEVPLALLVLGGYLVVMPAITGSGRDTLARACAAGLLCGIAAGLKPTAIVYAPALGFAVWAGTGFRLTGLRLLIAIGVTSVAGFAIAYAAWGYALWRLTGNPIFPMFNQVFHSAWMPLASGTDPQFMPRSVLQALFYPFWWLKKNATQGGNTFADARYAIAMLALLVAGGLSLVRRGQLRAHPARRMLFAFLCASYVLWLALYSILRYAIPIEAMTGLAMLATAELAAGMLPAHRQGRFIAYCMGVLLVAIVGTTRYTDWGHAPFAKKAFPITAPELPAGSLVVVLSQPHAYVIPFMKGADSSTFVGITWLNTIGAGYELDRRIQAIIRKHEGPMLAIVRDTDDSKQALGQLAGIVPGTGLGECSPIASGLELTRRKRDISDGLRVCSIVRPAAP